MINRIYKTIICLSSLIFITGSLHAADKTSTHGISPKNYQFSSVTIVFSPQAHMNLSKAKGFSEEKLIRDVVRYFDRNGLINSESPYHGKLMINNSNVKTKIKFTFNKIDTISAEFVIETHSGQRQEAFDISIKNVRGRLLSDSAKTRIKEMIERMSTLAITVLTGV